LSRHLAHGCFVEIDVATVDMNADRDGTVVEQPPVALFGFASLRPLSRSCRIVDVPDIGFFFADLIIHAPH
jgi:hypothetical protein